MAKAIVSTVNPKAKATPTKPIPRLGNAAARTALPHPPNTNQKVPKNSAKQRFPRLMVRLHLRADKFYTCFKSNMAGRGLDFALRQCVSYSPAYDRRPLIRFLRMQYPG